MSYGKCFFSRFHFPQIYIVYNTVAMEIYCEFNDIDMYILHIYAQYVFSSTIACHIGDIKGSRRFKSGMFK